MQHLTLIIPDRRHTLTTAGAGGLDTEPEVMPLDGMEPAEAPDDSPVLTAIIRAAETRASSIIATALRLPQAPVSPVAQGTTTRRTQARYAFD